MKDKIAVTAVLIFLVLLIVLPLCIVFLISIVPRWSTVFPTSFSLEWWMATLKPKFLKTFSNTLIVTTVATLITVGYAIIASYLFAFHDFKGKEFLATLTLAPTYVAGVVLALGLLKTYPFLRNTFWMLMLGHFAVISPIVFRVVLSSMIKIPNNLVEASYSLASSKINTFRRIILPLSKHGILAGTLLSVGMSVSELSVSILLYSSRWVTLPIQIYLERGWGTLGIAGVLSTILVFVSLLTVFSVDYFGQELFGWIN